MPNTVSSQPTWQAHSQDATRDMPDAVNYIQRLVLWHRSVAQGWRHTLGYQAWCISQPPLHTMGSRVLLEFIMAHITRHGFVRRVHSSLSQASCLPACYCRSHYHIRGCLRLQCRHIQGLTTHDIYTCHARVYQVRHYYRHYHSVQTLSQHQAVAS